MKNKLMLWGLVLLGFGILAVILYFVGLRNTLTNLLQLGWLGFLLLAGLVLLTLVSWALSWWVILRAYGINTSWRAVWRARLSGFAISYLTPSMYFGGEPVSVYLLTKTEHAPPTKITASVIVTKFLEGINLILFLYIGGFFALTTLPLPVRQEVTLLAGSLILGGLLSLGFINFAGRRLWATRLLVFFKRILPARRFVGWVIERVRETEEYVFEAFRYHRRQTLIAFFVTLLATLCIYVRPLVFFYFSQKIVFSFAQLSLFFALSVLLGALFWLTPGGIGIFEGGMIGILSLAGIGAGGAVAFALSIRPLEFLAVGLGLFYMMGFGLRQTLRKL